MRKALLITISILCSFALLAQVPSGYYDSANGKTGDELKAALHEIIKDHTVVSYANLLNAYAYTDCDANGKIWDIYSNYHYELDDNCGSTPNQEGICWNREHLWPQSWFNETSGPKSDLFHVYPTDAFVNGKRSNYPFGKVNNPTYTSGNGSKLGPCVTIGYSGTVFEPVDEYKGDIARSFFYMSVRYYNEDSGWGSSAMTDKSVILPWAMTMLLQWSDDDPVSDKETARNNAVEGFQGNRNPFIDHPEYARMIWDPDWTGGGGNTPMAGGFVKVTNTEELTDGEYLIIYEEGSKAFNGGLTTLDATNNNISVTINNHTIESSTTADAAVFTISTSGNYYTIRSASGYYIGQTGNTNGLMANQTTTYTNTLSFDNDGNVVILSSGGAYLRFNNGTNDQRFRYYKSSSYINQKAIQLYKKNIAYTITLASVEHGTISANAEEASEGTTITLTATPDSGYELDHWTVTDDNNNDITVNNNKFEMPASNVTVSASFTYVGLPFTQKYHLVTDASQLVAGRTYLIVNTTAGKALGITQNNNNRSAVDVTIDNNTITSIDNTGCELTLGGQSNVWTFFDANWGNNGGYLYAASSSSNYLKTQATNDDNGKWSISIASNGTATIIAQGSNTRNNLRYNPNNNTPIFSCYGSSSNLAKAELYIRAEEFTHTTSETIANIFPFDKHVVHSGTTLTIIGNASCTEASQLVIEEGGQLIHHSDGVKATIKKAITAYTNDNDGWYTIATPFTDFDPSQVANGTYDLYAYSESSSPEWLNYKNHLSDFPVSPSTGYLYAHSPSSTLRLNGTILNGDYTETIALSFGNSYLGIKGFNLLANPTTHDITFTKSDEVADGYYYLNNHANWEYTTDINVPVGRGFLVKANAAGQSVVINPQNRHGENETYLCIQIDHEKAYVKLTQGVSMPLLSFKGHTSNIYLSHDNQPYIMLVSEGTNSVELNYQPKGDGTHLLCVDTEGLNLTCLHLIDRLTGNDVDLLKTPSYTFESHSNDSSARFQLVFNTDKP